MLALLLATVALAAPVPVAQKAPIDRAIPLLENTPVTRYNTDFTRNIFVKQIHSHNDYWRDVPLFTALSYGVQSVEADVWHFEGDDILYLGHHKGALGPQRTFQSAYIDPLVEILTKANPENSFTVNETGRNGVFDTDATATLYLWVDVKTNGTLTWPYVESALQPLRERGWLSYVNGTEFIQGPITVIGTGNTPYDYVASVEDRYFFNDGPLTQLTDATPSTLNPIASVSLLQLIWASPSHLGNEGLNETQLATLNGTVAAAHALGIKTRIWDVPWWPVELRNNLWRQILDSGSDFLNADDLELASQFV